MPESSFVNIVTYQAIVIAIYQHVVPSLVFRISTDIASGTPLLLAENCTLTNQGLQAITGELFWKKHHQVPLSELRFGFGAGLVTFGSSQNPKFKTQISLRRDWNAVLLKEIVDGVVDQLRRRKP